MSEQVIGWGSTVERSTDNATWETIPECKGVAIPDVTQEYPEVTSLDSPGGFREYIRGLRDGGEISVPCGYTAAGFEQQEADRAESDAIYYRVTMPLAPSQSTTGDQFEFRGFPSPKLEFNDLGEPIAMNIQLRVTGDYTWTRGS